MMDDDTDLTEICLRDAQGMELRLMDWGATWLSCRVPMPGRGPREVLLGAPTAQAHRHNTAYFGATIGRYANRIAGAQVDREGRTWPLTPNPGSRHQLHGGPDGFDRRRWAVRSSSPSAVCFALDSPDGDQGFPGHLHVEVHYRLPGHGVIEMEALAQVDAPSPVCLTNHSYFNLDDPQADARAHTLCIDASQMLPVDAELIPTGPLHPVAGTSFDFRRARPIGPVGVSAHPGDPAWPDGAYDHAYLLDPACADLSRPCAELVSADARLHLAIFTSLPALQVYTGQFLADQTGREGGACVPFGGVALEPQFLPDSPHHPEWPQPNGWLLPGQTYRHRIHYRFSSP